MLWIGDFAPVIARARSSPAPNRLSRRVGGLGGGPPAAAPGSGQDVQIDDETWSETAFYGFTHRGFFNLTRKVDGDGSSMDPLQVRYVCGRMRTITPTAHRWGVRTRAPPPLPSQAAVLKQLQLDKEVERVTSTSSQP